MSSTENKIINFNKPNVGDSAKKYVAEALTSIHQHGDGPYTNKASKLLSNIVGGGHVLLTPSCTHALEMASMLAEIGPGDEVILPSFTFTSAATAIVKFGATPVFVDSEELSPNLDVRKVERAITPNTKAISWVNYAGTAPDIDGLKHLASEYKLILIEDNAHGLGGTYKGKPLGSFGDFATQSFHATKNIQCGEGGAIVINNSKYIERAEIIREKGTNRRKFSKGEIKKYTWVDQGSSYLLAEVCAAILLGQLEEFDAIQKIRIDNWNQYSEEIQRNFKNVTYLESFEQNVAHMFAVINEGSNETETLRSELLRFGIHAATHYEPLDQSIAGIKYGKSDSNTPNAARFAKTILRLPLWSTPMKNEINYVTNSLYQTSFGEKIG